MTALFEEASWLWRMDERLDRVREVGVTEAGRQIAVVPLQAHHTVRQSGVPDAAGRELRLD